MEVLSSVNTSVVRADAQPRKWTVVECYDQESSVAKHREHPEYKTFAGALVALLENGQASLDVHQFQEL
ncbi:hypothetical protein PF005_g25168 [Phytophthora fragariae]|uniref:ABM domain-containing protein n=1 Tax=Phytophthora fragariae TaxID=53985 RepID=A0A6A3W0S9_9STRA|nr:hypothetical protein PF005_g25168 [Phytophthora fragariae]